MPMGPPRKPVDTELVEGLAGIGCTMEEISAFAKVSVDTLERRYAEIIKKGRELGKSSLRRMQWKAAEVGNVTMMIWLGKQLLAQRDNFDLNQNIKVEDTTADDLIELLLGRRTADRTGQTAARQTQVPSKTIN